VADSGLVSYGLDTTGIRVRSYLIGTAFGAAPSTAIYAHLGAAALKPDRPAFLLSVAAAVLLAVAGAVVSALARRRGTDGERTVST
jgi:uncharacterized membrane protein YdjX (TVP38/TMEM64 family)